MKRFNSNTVKLIFAVLFVALAPLSNAGLLESGFSATYEVSHKSYYLGDAQRKLSKQADGSWLYRSDTKAKGIASLLVSDVINEKSIIKQSSDGYAPQFYEYHQHGGKRVKKYSLTFDWTKNEIVNDFLNQRLELKPKTHDLLSFQIQLMHDLQNSQKVIEYTIADKKRVETYELKVVQTSTIETPFKTFNAIEMISNKIRDKLQFRIWVAPELNYLPVRILNTNEKGEETELVLKAVKF